MTPDKIEEGFTEWAKFLEDDHAGYIYSEQAWQACAEWMLSQASSKNLRDMSELYASVVDQIKEKGASLVPEDICNAFVDGYQQARLSSAKDFEKEVTNRVHKAMDGMGAEIAENKHHFDVLKDDHAILTSEIAELQSKLQYNQEWFNEAQERIKALEGELLKAFPMIKFLHDYTERFPFATKLVSKKEST
jgi:hypothetical protein